MTTDTSDLEMLIGPNDVCALLNIKESQEAQKLLLEVQEERKQRKGFMRWFSKD